MKRSGRSQIEPFRVMGVLDRANQMERAGRRVLHLEAGQPHTSAPRTALAGVSAALNRDVMGYTESLGRPALRSRIARHYHETYGVEIDSRRVIVTSGSSAGFVLSFLGLFEAGDDLAIANPGYPAYRNTARALGLNPVLVDCGADMGFRLNCAAVRDAPRTKGLLVASPSNPCGTVIPGDELSSISQYCRERDMWLISDEIYHGIVYGEPARTALEFNPDAIVVNSFSKYFSMTGWRIGWLVVPEYMVAAFESLAQNLYISPSTVSQVAALHAFEGQDELRGNVETYRHNRGVMLSALSKLGLGNIAPADGAFYIYADVSPLGMPSNEVAERLLDDVGIAATSGHDFDPVDGDRWLRFSYAASSPVIEEAADVLTTWFQSRQF